MSSDDELFSSDNRRTSAASPAPPSAGGVGPDSPKFDNNNEGERRGSLNGNISTHTTANDIANTDDKVRQVLYSDIGLSVLLNRAKQDVATCKELATVLKKRAILEDEHGKSLQKLAKATQDTLKRQEVKQQGFNRHFYQATRAWDESTASSLHFSAQLHAMAEEITELSKVSDRKRKTLKHEALRDETNVTTAEGVAEKARSKHESISIDLERAISAAKGESFPTSKGRFGMAKKSGAQVRFNLIKHEEDLRQKALEADRDMQMKQQMAADLRRELMTTLRPRNVKNLVDLITETDSGLSFHLQKFAVLTETLAANQGTAVLPLTAGRLGFSALIGQINDGKDFRDYVLEFTSKVPSTNRYSGPSYQTSQAEAPSAPVGYTRPAAPPQLPEVDINRGELNEDVQRVMGHTNGSSSQHYLPPMNFQSSSAQQYQGQPPPVSQQPATYIPSSYGAPSSQPQPTYPSSQPPTTYSSTQPQPPYPTSSTQSSPMYPPVNQATGNYPPPSSVSPPSQLNSSIQPTPASAFIPPSSFTSPTPPPEKNIPPAQIPQASNSPHLYNSTSPTPPRYPATRKGHTFGVSLDEVISRENATLPLIVAQCVIAVDQFGINTEGIYRVSGSVSTLAKLKELFDFEPEHIDFRTPAGFFGDIHAVAGILKQYLRELPDPLLTRGFYTDFLRVAPIEPDFHRRDAIHSLVNDLPDANYSCLRTLALHLYRISQHADQNKMTVQNLANIFGPTLLGSEGSGMEDARAQIRVAETIITYATDMFELGTSLSR